MLQRRLGLFDAAAIIVSNVIGGGILFTPPQVAAAVPNPVLARDGSPAACWRSRGRWRQRELAALRPHAGGEHVYLRAAFGRLAGVPDRLDVVRRRLLRRDGGKRRRAGVLRRPLHPGGIRRDAAFVRGAAAVDVPLTVLKQALVALAAIAAMA